MKLRHAALRNELTVLPMIAARMLLPVFICISLIAGSCDTISTQTDPYAAVVGALQPLYPRKQAPQPGDWLDVHHEYYQSYDAYRASRPYRPDSAHRTIYVTVIDKFSPAEEALISKTIACLAAFYQLPVQRLQPALPADRYQHGRYLHTADRQLLTTYFIDTLLPQIQPPDAAMLLAFTHEDLYPGAEWNYVFGQASIPYHTGIWSIHRFGNPDTDFSSCLSHTVKTALHEAGHVFSLPHCTRYACCMNGANSLSEATRTPVYFCPDCLAKLCWNLHQDPAAKLQSARAYWQQQGDIALVTLYRKSLAALE